MLRRCLVLPLILLAACSGATGPARLDPTVLITNHAQQDTLYFTWRDGQGIAGSVAVLPGQQSCTRFLAQADSAYFEAHTPLNASAYTQAWFDPATRPAWTMVVQTNGGIAVTDVSPTEPC